MNMNNGFQFNVVINAMLNEQRLLQAEVKERCKEAALTSKSNTGRAQYMLIKATLLKEKIKALEVDIKWCAVQQEVESKWSYKVISAVTNILTKAVG